MKKGRLAADTVIVVDTEEEGEVDTVVSILIEDSYVAEVVTEVEAEVRFPTCAATMMKVFRCMNHY